MSERPSARLFAFGLAVLVSVVMLLIGRRLIDAPGLGDRVLYMAFLANVLIAAYVGGFWPGILATAVSALGASNFVDALGSPRINTLEHAVAPTLFVLLGTVISGLTEALHRSRHRIAASDRRYAITLASIGDAVIATDTQARVTFLNAAAEALTGWPLADAVGRPFAEVFRIINEQTRQPLEDPAAKVLRLGSVVGLGNHTALLTRDGREVPIDDCGAPIIDDRGAPAGVVVVFRDVTQRRKAEEAEVFRRANEWLELAVRGSNVGIWELEFADGGPRPVRRHYLNVWEQLGYESAPADRDNALADSHPDDRAVIEDAVRGYLAGETTELETEIRLRHKDGSHRTMLVRGAAVHDAAGKPIRLVGIVVDITRLSLAEEELRASEQRFRTFADHAADAFFVLDERARVLDVNRRACEALGYTRDELIGKTPYDFDPDHTPARREALRNQLDAGKTGVFESRHRRTDGTCFPVEVRVQPFWVGDRRWVVSLARDITERKRVEEALRQAKEAAEAANRAKDEFLANVSHEIRTPMNAILGMTELALDTPLTAEQREYLAIVKSSADALLKVINDLLDFAKIEAGKLKLDHSDFSLRRVLGETLRALALRAHRKGLELACQIRPEVPDALVGDPGRLRQILLNLVGNAIKFTEQGEVVVRVEAGGEHTPTEPDLAMPGLGPLPVLHFAISDTGIGIPREKQAKIFQAFEQVDSSRTRQYEGTGLGLSIAARLVALMGGEITVESEPGRGSTFRFTAGFESQPDPPSGPHERPLVDLHGLRVLVVDDNATNRQILEEWLRAWHTEPTAVADGLKALDALWMAVAVSRPFALVLLDARMPGVDGLAVAESILQNPVLSSCRIILLTSEDLHGDLARYRRLGIAAYVMKPVPQEELLETIYRVLSRPDSAEGAVDPMGLIVAAALTAATTAAPVRRLRILVAEDNPFNQKLVEHLLGRRGHDVHVASDGREALAALEQDRFDLMLLDVHMPGYDGFQVIEALRSRERATGGHLPVIALTARAMESDRERCLQAGMDDYLAKPFSAADLFGVMARVLADRPAAEPEPSARGRRESLLDPPTLLAACDNDPTLLRKLIDVFQADAPAALRRIGEAVRERDAPRLREEAHRLRGLLSTFSATTAAEAARLEAMGASGQPDLAARALEELTEMVERLGRLLEALSIERLRRHADDGPA
jgi:two-component system sensor histidine kinase/response regulator